MGTGFWGYMESIDRKNLTREDRENVVNFVKGSRFGIQNPHHTYMMIEACDSILKEERYMRKHGRCFASVFSCSDLSKLYSFAEIGLNNVNDDISKEKSSDQYRNIMERSLNFCAYNILDEIGFRTRNGGISNEAKKDLLEKIYKHGVTVLEKFKETETDAGFFLKQLTKQCRFRYALGENYDIRDGVKFGENPIELCKWAARVCDLSEKVIATQQDIIDAVPAFMVAGDYNFRLFQHTDMEEFLEKQIENYGKALEVFYNHGADIDLFGLDANTFNRASKRLREHFLMIGDEKAKKILPEIVYERIFSNNLTS
jgi:hypothetical protein